MGRFSKFRLGVRWVGRVLLIGLVLVVATEILLRFRGAEIGWEEGRESPVPWVERLEGEVREGRAEAWLFGNGVLACGVDEAALSGAMGRRCIVLPLGGADLAGQAAMMRHFFRVASTKPKDIVFCITKDDVNSNGERAWVSKQYLDWDRLPARLHPDRLFRLCASRQMLVNTLKSAVFGRDTDSSKNPSEPSSAGVVPPEKYAAMRRLMLDYAVDSSSFDEIDVFAVHNRCRVHVVLVPVSAAYLDFHDAARPDFTADDVAARIADLCAIHGFEFHDFSRMAPDDLALYSDPYHLTAAGREVFTTRLAEALRADDVAAADEVGDGRVAPLRVACIGDSITEGVGIRTPYPEILRTLASNRWEVGNFGVSGKTLLLHSGRDWASTPAAREALEFRPDVVVAMFGINDKAHPALLPSFVEDGLAVLARFREVNPDVRFFICTPTPHAPARRRAAANRVIRETLVPMVEELALRSSGRVIPIHCVYPCSQWRLPDGTHPDPKGARLIAETVYDYLGP